MRLHRLAMTAFGPFADTQTVDFDALAAGGLFLLHGATGAGKSSVLDAVCYALYGTLPGSRPRTRLRSDHAAAEVRTEVVLELTLGGRRLEITRSPEQVRTKRRGQGLTTDKAQTLLRERVADGAEDAEDDNGTDSWRASSRSHQEIGTEIQQLLGMSREQFCQVVLLPQGGFARFLHATAPERAELLGRLFDTARFGAVEGWLAERRQQTEKACQAVLGEIGSRLERLREAAGTDEPPPLDVHADCLCWAAQLRVEARELLTIAESWHRLALERRRPAADRARAVEVLADRQQRHAHAVRRSHELEARSGEQRTAEHRLERARRAEAVAPLLTLHQQALLTRRRLDEAERRARAALPAAVLAPLDADRADTHRADAEKLAAAEHATREELGGLRALLPAEEQFQANERSRRRLEAERDDAESQRAEAAEWLEQWPALRDRAAASLDRAKLALSRSEQLDTRLAEVRQRCEAAERAEALTNRLSNAEERARTLRESANQAHERWLELRERRLQGMAAELAARLAEGEACPVCGSAEHPAPARPGPGQVTREQEQHAEQAHREAADRADTAREDVQGLRRQIDSLTAVAGDRSAAELRGAADQLRAEQAEAQQQAAAGLRAQEELDRLQHEQGLRSEAEVAAASMLAARTAGLDALADEQIRLTAELERGRSGAVSVAARVAQLEPLAERLNQAVSAVREAAAGAQALAGAEASARAAAEREGFADPGQAERALLPAAEALRLREAVERHRAELARVRTELADEQLLAAVRQPVADPAAEQAADRVAEQQLQQAYARLQAARDRCAALDRLSAGLTVEVRRLEPLAAEHATVAGLAGLAAGTSSGNRFRMSLETYVLAARLEQVAAAAGSRLAVMSQGRYSLAHTDLRARGGGRSGLGLSVLDAWTGQERDTSTLSGGESFFASLALALGLADVVTDEAGGMPLDTLFIDEGFGSLDEDTLEDVLDVLDRLRERDRAVGIVSHVADLRSRIPTRLEVRKGRNGSTLHQT
ncbi:AAA family ATPase [Streptacidiphilus carbonis]|uniref:AAA family ATPase n=1 Tax=Streptacidiphilus carbonis TaxID=105422 RepID=UPI0005A7FC70|nr:SMC family ATPase [Streptacidiphilus carbonis]